MTQEVANSSQQLLQLRHSTSLAAVPTALRSDKLLLNNKTSHH